MNGFRALVRKDLLLLLKSESQVASTLLFALVLAAVSAFSFRIVGFGPERTGQLLPGILWIIFLFVSAVALNQNLALEREGGALRAVVLTGVDPFVIFHAKISVLGLFLFLVQTVVIVSEGLLLEIDLLPAAGGLLLIAALLALGISSLGALFSAIAVVSRAREVLLPLLLFPLAIPALIAAVAAGRAIVAAGQIDWSDMWLLFLAGWAVISWTLGWLLFGFAEGE